MRLGRNRNNRVLEHYKKFTMIHKESNDYLDTTKPLLYLLRITSVLPFPPSEEDGIPKFLSSRIAWLISTMIFFLVTFVAKSMIFRLVSELANEFSMRRLVITLLRVLGRMAVFSAPFNTWGNRKLFAAYWSKWKTFQNDYESLTGITFESRVKTRVKIVVLVSIVGWLWSIAIMLLYVRNGRVDLTYMVECFILLTIFLKGTYWYINGLYLRSAFEDVIGLGKKLITGDKNGNKLRRVSTLWVTLCDLDKEFYAAHSFLFFSYFINVYVGFIFFTFVCLNNSTFGEVLNRRIQFTGMIGCAGMIFVICETAYSVYEQMNQKTKRMLLLRNTIHMNTKMLYSVLHFLQLMEVRKPKIDLNGFLALHRSLFPAIWGICMNYMIILRQFYTR